MKAAQYISGGVENLKIGQVPVPLPGGNELLLKVCATAINRADTLQRKGLYPPPAGASAILGLEAAGVVHSIGPGDSRKWKIGERVMALLSGGGNAEYVPVHEDLVMPIPKVLTFDEAAAIPEVWLTAYQLLHFVGCVSSGDIVLIHAGGSGVGTAAVQLARLAGAIPYVTAGSAHKIDIAKSLGAEDGFNYREESFGDRLMKVTDGHGADLILDCVGASFWKQNVVAAALDSTWILYGSLGGVEIVGPILSAILMKRISLKGSLLRSRTCKYKAQLVKAFTDNILPRFESKELKIVIDTVFQFEEIAEAHKMMEENRNVGKLILRVSTD